MEESIEYNLIGRINFQSNKYNIYRDNKYRKFYLRIINTDKEIDLTYPTLDEYINLNKIFGMNYIKDIVYFIKNDEIKESKQKLSKKKKIQFIPKVLTKSGLVGLIAAISLSGCNVNIPIKKTDYLPYRFLKLMSDEEIFEDRGYSVDEIAEGIYVPKEINFVKGIYKNCKNVEEFKKYVGMEGVPTYEDLLDAIDANKNITGKYSEWFKEGINNLSKNKDFDNVDFSVLLYNIQKMKIQEKTIEEMVGDLKGVTAAGYFSPYENLVTITENVEKSVFLHEALGHGSTLAMTENKVVFQSYGILLTLDRKKDQTFEMDYNTFGYALEEGKAQLLTEAALNYVEDSTTIKYDIEKETFREIKETLGLSWEDIINNSMTLKIFSKMSELGIKDPIKYIDNSDILHYADMYDEIDDSVKFKNNMGNYLLEYAEIQIKAGRSKEDVLNQISEMIKDSFAYPYSIGLTTRSSIDITNMKEYEDYVLELIEKLPEIQETKEESKYDDFELDY